MILAIKIYLCIPLKFHTELRVLLFLAGFNIQLKNLLIFIQKVLMWCQIKPILQVSHVGFPFPQSGIGKPNTQKNVPELVI